MSKILLLGLAAVYFLWSPLKLTGVGELVTGYVAAKLLPSIDGDGPLRTVYTGFSKLDAGLARLVVLRWPIFDGHDPALSLHAISIRGCVDAAWALATLEGYRRGDQGVVALPALILLSLLRNITTGFGFCIYCALHLYVSVTASNPTIQNMAVSRAVFYSLSISLVAGYAIPAAVIFSPVSSDFKQIFISVRFLSPAVASGIVYLSQRLFSASREAGSMSGVGSKRKHGKYTRSRSLRIAYGVIFLAASLPHFSAVLDVLSRSPLPFTTIKLHLPALVQDLLAIHPANVYKLPLPWFQSPTIPAQNIKDAIQPFIAREYLITSIGILAWAGSLYSHIETPRYSRILALIILAGPMGAAVDTLWGREELVMKRAESESSVLGVKGRPSGGSGMGKWHGGMKVLALDD